jgi:pilus assembly protein Flp/PilA
MKHFLADEQGATPIEYCLLAALMAIVSLSGVTSVGPEVSRVFARI